MQLTLPGSVCILFCFRLKLEANVFETEANSFLQFCFASLTHENFSRRQKTEAKPNLCLPSFQIRYDPFKGSRTRVLRNQNALVLHPLQDPNIWVYQLIGKIGYNIIYKQLAYGGPTNVKKALVQVEFEPAYPAYAYTTILRHKDSLTWKIAERNGKALAACSILIIFF